MMREAFRDLGLASLFGTTPALSDAANPTHEHSPSITYKKQEQAIVEALRDTFAQAFEQGWDGYDATPVSAATLSYAWQFLEDLPSDVDLPEIGADTDGDISLDWDYGPRNIFSVRVGRDGTLHYAGLFGHETYHGSAILRQGIPKAVAEGILRAIRTSQLNP
jgi:hypothetical protein